MISLNNTFSGLIIFAVFAIQTGEAWSFWKWLGITTDVPAIRNSERRFFHEHKKSKHPSKYSDDEYETYYVEVPHRDWDKYKEQYNHDKGVKVWEFPSLWDGNIVIPNFYTARREAERIKGESIEDDRTVQGFDNRVGIRLAVPFMGDFQWMRETGPGDFVPELGPGKFQYPGPGDVDAAGGIALRGPPDEDVIVPPTPVVDLTAFQGLQNYPWYTR